MAASENLNLIQKLRFTRGFPPPEVRRNLRERAGLLQRDIAGAIGVDRASVSRYELGTREPSGKVVRRYASVLDALTVELSKGGPGP